MMKLQEYQLKNKRVGEFGITYLDDALRGILLGDLILIGARSGAGKSTIGNFIALHNGTNGTKTSLFSLENFEGDMFLERAYQKYKEITKDYTLKQRDFICGNYKADMFANEKAEKYANELLSCISIINRQKNYGIEKLADDMMREAEKGSELIVLDHIDYLQMEEKENTHFIHLMNRIREIQDTFKVAVVAISHLRKAQNTKDCFIIPSIDEFYGSSAKVKEATGVIMLAPDDEKNMNDQSFLKYTWCTVRKLRHGGVDNKAAKLMFNTKTGNYEKDYTLFKCNYSGTKVQEMF